MDAITKGLGAALRKEQPEDNLKPIGFARHFSDAEKKYTSNELESLAIVRGLSISTYTENR